MDESNRFFGFMMIMIGGGLFGSLIMQGLENPDVINELGRIDPRLSANSESIALMSGFIVCLITVAIPPLILFKNGGSEKMERIGEAGKFGLLTIISLLAIPSFAYLLGVGWFTAKHSLGF